MPSNTTYTTSQTLTRQIPVRQRGVVPDLSSSSHLAPPTIQPRVPFLQQRNPKPIRIAAGIVSEQLRDELKALNERVVDLGEQAESLERSLRHLSSSGLLAVVQNLDEMLSDMNRRIAAALARRTVIENQLRELSPQPLPPRRFAKRLDGIQPSAIRELFKVAKRPGVISLAGGFPDATLFDVKGLQDAVNTALDKTPVAALQYGATEGYDPLREQLAHLMRSKGVTDLSAENVIVTTGSQQALDLLGRVMIDEGSNVLVGGPSFLAAIQCFKLSGGHVLGIPTDADGEQIEELERLIRETQPRLVYLIPNFSNPSGVTMSLERRLQVLQLAVKYGVLIVEDDPYGDLYFHNQPPPPSLLALTPQVPGSRNYVAYCGSLSKVLSPGLRLGYLIAPPDVLTQVTTCKQFSDSHTSTFAQVTASNYLASGRLPHVLHETRARYAGKAATMKEALAGLGDAVSFNDPKGGMFYWAQLTGAGGKENNAAALAARAIQRDVAFVPGENFYAEKPPTNALRLSYSTVGVENIRKAIGEIGKAM